MGGVVFNIGQVGSNSGAYAGGFLCGLIGGVAIGGLIGAVILRAAIAWYNKLQGGPDSEHAVNEPDFGRAFVISVVTAVVNQIAQFSTGFMFGMSSGSGISDRAIKLWSLIVSIPASFLVMAAILTAMLPTTFGRASLISLLYFVIVLIIIGVIVLLVFAMGGLGR